MNLGYFTMPLHPPGSDPVKTLPADLEQMVMLEKWGFKEAWVGEHFTSVWENIPCPDLFIAQALAKTSTMKFGTGVSCLPNHNPVMLAQRIAQLDNMAQGRFYWGIGAGGFPGDFTLFDIDAANFEQRKMTRDILNTVLDLWNNPAPGIREAKHWRFRVPDPVDEIGLRLHLQPYQKPHPPIGVAGVSPKSDMLTLAGERGWIPMSISIVPTPSLQGQWQTYSTAATKAGRTPLRSDWRIARDVYIGDTPEQARRDVLDGVIGRDWRDYFIPLLKLSKLMIAVKKDPAQPDEDVTLEQILEDVWIVGDVDEVTEKLRKLYQDVGGFNTLLVIGHEWEPRDKWLKSFDRLVNQVMPRLSDLT